MMRVPQPRAFGKAIGTVWPGRSFARAEVNDDCPLLVGQARGISFRLGHNVNFPLLELHDDF